MVISVLYVETAHIRDQNHSFLAFYTFGSFCKSHAFSGLDWMKVLNASRNALTSVSEISTLVELRALILNSEFPFYTGH